MSEVGRREIELICPTGSAPLAGTSLAVFLVGGLLLLNPFGLRDPVLADRSPGAAFALLLFGFVATFGSTAKGSAITAVGQREIDDDELRRPSRATTDAKNVAPWPMKNTLDQPNKSHPVFGHFVRE